MVTVTVWKMFKSHDFGPWHTQISCSLFTFLSENLLHHSLLNSVSQDSQTSPCVCCFLNLVATEPATKLKATTSEDIVVKLWNISIFFVHTYTYVYIFIYKEMTLSITPPIKPKKEQPSFNTPKPEIYRQRYRKSPFNSAYCPQIFVFLEWPWIVERRCAMAKEVRPCNAASNAWQVI